MEEECKKGEDLGQGEGSPAKTTSNRIGRKSSEGQMKRARQSTNS